MKEWTRDIEIDASIETVWKLFSGDLQEIQKIMPNVVENKPVKVTENGVGTVYRQKYKEGKRVQEYDVETLEYENKADYKRLKTAFNLANIFEITTTYELKKLDEHRTYFKYTTTNNPKKWYMKLLLKLASSDKVVVQFMERVKQVAEAEEKVTN